MSTPLEAVVRTGNTADPAPSGRRRLITMLVLALVVVSVLSVRHCNYSPGLAGIPRSIFSTSAAEKCGIR